MMVATFNSKPSGTIISCYSPTNVSEETDLVTFYNKGMRPVGGDIVFWYLISIL